MNDKLIMLWKKYIKHNYKLNTITLNKSLDIFVVHLNPYEDLIVIISMSLKHLKLKLITNIPKTWIFEINDL